MSTFQNPNQFTQTPILGMPDERANLNVKFCIINPDSTFENFKVGTVLKLVAGTPGDVILVDAAEQGDTPYGVICYNQKKNTYLPGSAVQVYAKLSVLYLEASEAIPRRSRVSFDNGTTGNPTVEIATDSNATIGEALGQAAAAGDLVRIEVDPAAALTS